QVRSPSPRGTGPARLAGAASTSRCADAAAGPGPAARIRSVWGKPTQARRAAADHAGPPGPRSMPERTQCESAEGGQEMSGDVIVTIALNAALRVDYAVGDAGAEGIRPISKPGYRAGGRGVTVARVLRAFGHDVLAAGLAGGVSGELVREELAQLGRPAAFTLIRGVPRRIVPVSGPGGPETGEAAADPAGLAGSVLRFGEAGPY